MAFRKPFKNPLKRAEAPAVETPPPAPADAYRATRHRPFPTAIRQPLATHSPYGRDDLLAYYDAAAPHLLPLLGAQAVSPRLYPNGLNGDFFPASHLPNSWPLFFDRHPESGLRIQTAKGLLFLIHAGCIDLALDSKHHFVWKIRTPLDKPFGPVRKLARRFNGLLQALGFETLAVSAADHQSAYGGAVDQWGIDLIIPFAPHAPSLSCYDMSLSWEDVHTFTVRTMAALSADPATGEAAGATVTCRFGLYYNHFDIEDGACTGEDRFSPYENHHPLSVLSFLLPNPVADWTVPLSVLAVGEGWIATPLTADELDDDALSPARFTLGDGRALLNARAPMLARLHPAASETHVRILHGML